MAEDCGEEIVVKAKDETGEAFKSLMSRFEDLGSTASQVSNQILGVFNFNDDALNLADSTKKMAVQFGQADRFASQLQQDILDLSALTGRGLSTFTELSNALGMTGQSLSDLSKSTQQFGEDGRYIQTIWGEQEVLGSMIDAFGMGADSVVEFSKGTRVLGLSITEVADRAVAFQNKFQMPGMIQALPEATLAAIDAISEFGTSVTGNAQSIIDNTLSLGAVFSKTFGRTMRESVQTAAGALKSLYGESEGIRSVFLGLDSDFSPLVQSFLEAGMNISDVQSLIENSSKSQKGLIQFADQVRSIQMGFQQANNDLAAERFMMQIRRSAPDAIKQLLLVDGALEEAKAQLTTIDELNKNGGFMAFQKMSEGMWSTGKVAIDVFNNLVNLSKVIVGLVFEPLAKGIYESAGSNLQAFNMQLVSFTKTLTEEGSFFKTTMVPVLSQLGRVLLLAGTAAGGLATTFSTFMTGKAAFKGVQTIMNLLPGMEGLAGFLPKIGKGFSMIGTKVLLPVMAIKSLLTAFSDMSVILSDPEATFTDKVTAIFGGLSNGVGDFVDSFLFGLPTLLTRVFIPNFTGTFGDALRVGVYDAFDFLKSGGIGQIVKPVASFIGNALASIDYYGMIKSVVSGATGFLKFMWFDLPKSVGTMIVNTLYNAFSDPNTWYALWDGLVASLKFVVVSMQAVLDGILDQFQTSTAGIGTYISDGFATTWDRIKQGFNSVMVVMIKGVTNLGSMIADKFSSLLSGSAAILGFFGAKGAADVVKQASVAVSAMKMTGKALADSYSTENELIEKRITMRRLSTNAALASQKAAKATAVANRKAANSFQALFSAGNKASSKADFSGILKRAKSIAQERIGEYRDSLVAQGVSGSSLSAQINEFVRSKSLELQSLQSAAASNNEGSVQTAFNQIASREQASPKQNVEQVIKAPRVAGPEPKPVVVNVPVPQVQITGELKNLLRAVDREQGKSTFLSSGLGG